MPVKLFDIAINWQLDLSNQALSLYTDKSRFIWREFNQWWMTVNLNIYNRI